MEGARSDCFSKNLQEKRNRANFLFQFALCDDSSGQILLAHFDVVLTKVSWS